MKRGDLFAIGEGRNVRLVCTCTGVQDGVISGYVWNGAWDFTLSGDILNVTAKGTTHSAKIVWQGESPGRIGGYNEAIMYVERRIGRWRITNYLIDSSIRLKEKWEQFTRALGAAKRAYLKVYEANSKFVEDEDDLIPF